jgi:hypothetical protein
MVLVVVLTLFAQEFDFWSDTAIKSSQKGEKPMNGKAFLLIVHVVRFSMGCAIYS